MNHTCECGCGQPTGIAAKTNRAQGQTKGQPNRFLAGHRPKKHPDYAEENRGYRTPCWIWQGAKDRNDYGMLKRNRQTQVAHRWYYERAKGPIPDDLELDHLCRERLCVNPDHLEAVTREENVRRGESFAVRNAAKTHCIHGHEFTATNTYVDTRGYRQCRTCRKKWAKEWARQH